MIFPWLPVINTWYHLALVRNLSNLSFFVNGALQNTEAISTDIIFNSSVDFYIGENVIDRGYYFNGWMDELRISKGIARWLGSFTPPTKEYGTSIVGDLLTGLFGKIGVRTLKPVYPLDVSGDAKIFGTIYNSSLTQGSIVFSGASGALSQDNANLFWNDSRNRLGLGTSNPVSLFDISGDVHFSNDMGFSGLPISIIRSSGDLAFMPNGVIGIGLTNPSNTDKLSILLTAGQTVYLNKSAEDTPTLNCAGYLALSAGAFGFETLGANDFTLRRNEIEICRVTATSFKPAGAGSINLGDGTDYWGDVSYKTLTDRGCLGFMDLGVELQNGTIVSDVEAIKAIKKDPVKMTVYGVPRLDYKTMPKVVYKPAPPKAPDGSNWLIDTDGKKYYHATIEDRKETRRRYYEEGAETTALLSIVLGAIKELSSRIDSLDSRLKIIETKTA